MSYHESYVPLTLALLLSSACGGQTLPTDDAEFRSPEDPIAQPGVVFSVIPAKSSFAEREPVTFVFRVDNKSEMDVSFDFTSGCQAYFEIERAGSSVFRQDIHVACITVLTELELAPGERRDYPFTWGKVDDKGAAVSSGEYVIVGFLADVNSPRVTATVRLD